MTKTQHILKSLMQINQISLILEDKKGFIFFGQNYTKIDHCGSVHCAWKHPVVVVVVRENSIMETSFLICDLINTQYMTNSSLICRVKIEYVTKNNIFGLKMMMKGGLEKNILKFIHAQAIFY